MESPTSPAPLGVWVVALLVALVPVLVGLAHARTIGAPASAKFVAFNLERLTTYAERAHSRSPALVVMIGTSALKYATNDEDSFEREVSQRLGHPVDVVRIVNNWGVYGDFEPLMPTITELRPDLLLVQRDLLVTDRPWWRHFLLDIARLKWALSRRGLWDHRDEDPARVQYDRPCWRREGVLDVDTQTRLREQWVVVDPRGPDAEALRVFVSEAAARNLRVAFIDVPRRDDLEARANLPREAALASPLVVAAIGQTESWGAPELPRAMYCDISHVSPQGRRVYSSWLEQRIAAALAGKPSAEAVSGVAF